MAFAQPRSRSCAALNVSELGSVSKTSVSMRRTGLSPGLAGWKAPSAPPSAALSVEREVFHFQRQQPVDDQLALRRVQDADLLERGSAARGNRPTGAPSRRCCRGASPPLGGHRLRPMHQNLRAAALASEIRQPVEGTFDVGLAEAGAGQILRQHFAFRHLGCSHRTCSGRRRIEGCRGRCRSFFMQRVVQCFRDGPRPVPPVQGSTTWRRWNPVRAVLSTRSSTVEGSKPSASNSISYSLSNRAGPFVPVIGNPSC